MPSLSWEIAPAPYTFLEKAMAPHSSTLAWKIPWAEEPGRPQSMGSWRVGHNWATSLSLFTFMHWKRKWQPIPVFLPGESQGQRTWWAAVYWVTQSQTRLKQLSSSSNREGLSLIIYFGINLNKSKTVLKLETHLYTITLDPQKYLCLFVHWSMPCA